MGYFEVISELLLTGLRLWDRKEARKYYEEYEEIKRRRYLEEAKPTDRRDMAMLDHFDYKLLSLSKKFISATQARGSNSSP